jgi:diguanylate cyclase (GGDEF)-like protein
MKPFEVGRGTRLVVSAVFLLLIAAYAGHLLWGRGRDGLDWVFDDFVQTGLLAGGTVVCSLGAANRSSARAPWVLLAIGLGSWTTGNVVWSAWIGPLAETPYPNLADALWLGFYPFMYAALVLLVRERVARFRKSMWLDGLIGALAMAGLAIGLLWPTLQQAGQGDPMIVVVNFAYPVADILLLAILAGVVAITRGRIGRALALVAAGLVVNAVGDIAYLMKVANGGGDGDSLLDLVWVVAQLLIAAGAWQSISGARSMQLEGWRVLAFPAFFAVTAVSLLAASAVGALPALPALLALATIVAIMVRTGLTFRENLTLLDARHQARTDDLTGLLNRRGFYLMSEARLSKATEDSARIAVLLLDLNHFKEFNDTLGHHAGDELLRDLAVRLRRALPEGAVARLGGDEFVALLPCDRGEADAIGAAHRVLDTLEKPFPVEGMVTQIGGSIGVALFPDHGADRAELLRAADVAMYRAKHQGSSVELYRTETDPNTRERLRLVGELHGALEREELVLHYQPKCDLITGAVSGVEALARWQHPTLGLLGPDHFIELAEQHGLMRRLTLLVFEMAINQQRVWRSIGIELPVSINVSPANLLDVRFPADVAKFLTRCEVPPGALLLEITENTVMLDPARALDSVARLSELGVSFSLDDFGTGYSSLAQLKRLPVVELKIDRSFVSEMHVSANDTTIVQSTIDLGRNLGLRVVAEGVEAAEHWSALRAMGCDTVQGFHLSCPLPADALTPWLTEHAARLHAGRAVQPLQSDWR